ncbi:type II secretion system protein [Romboutsia sedimentorum]|uniref:type II secretion system protein n=1 Tax=Romboutsia sedimentorum TaxID=1368474 RepID=UPI0024DE6E59|nr:type II secretion system protein [Romboutsia sedimentorum]MDK2585943.1 type II secretion system protein [Romboutsia sedimentorum]
MKNKKRKPGFTLVEMVIVVTILGILSSLGFMKFGQVQENAKLNSDYVAASSLATATNLALSDNKIKVGDKVTPQILKDHEYISTVPKSQSKDADFEIAIEKDSQVTVKVGAVVFYPKVEKQNSAS